MSPIARVLRLASIVICLIVITSFAIFAVDQTRSASSHQQEAVNAGAAATANTSGTTVSAGSSTHESGLHSTIDDISNKFTAPFKGLTSGSSSEWVVHGVNVLLALLVYGFGLGFLARVIRVRV
jgi:hypothetical protein